MKVAIIPARKGSKRCPGKNTALINDLSLSQHTMFTAIKSGVFDRVIVSTNDEQIIMESKQIGGVELHLRDEKLSNSTSTMIEVVRNVIKTMGIQKDDVICMLAVTNPLRTIEDIKGGVELYDSLSPKNTVISVFEMEYPIELTWKLDENRNVLVNTHEVLSTRKQDFTPSFRWNDAFVIDSAKDFLDENRNNFGYNPTPYFMPAERSFYIDYPWQLEIIKLLMEKNKNQ
jgi:CMP-N-acetylneuraminic acid synthetase